MNLQNFKLGTRLIAAFVFVCLLGAIVSAVGIYNMGRLDDVADAMYDRELLGVSFMKEANINLIYIARDRRSALLAPSAAEREAFLRHADESLERMRTNLDKAKPLFVTPKGQGKFAALEADLAEYHRQGAVLKSKIVSADLDKREDVARFLFGDFAKLANNIDDQMTGLAELKGQNAKDASEFGTQLYQSSRAWMIGLVSLALMSGVAIGYLMSRSLTRQLGAEPTQVVAVAQAVAEGDLGTRITLREGDKHSIMARLQAMQASLASVVSAVRSNSESVATASSQIAQGNADLSQRTEEQASALQQTAASMEQLGSTVKQNADNARQADQLATDASAVANRGGMVMGQVVDTMKDIDARSKRIADIIGVIDGIAFQTNILALNAAVEAARAGEQGRGFAVVAGEVRSLASRSAEAAKEIKGLIGASVERVEQGTALVDEAGRTMGEVVGAIQRVSQIVAEISAASAEQSAGVSQVGEAVTQMDQVTQQNAALVEESAAAAESLKGQAQQLVKVVSVFRLEA
ncbi:methyl-accepting chemotaxis protein [Piscinibacter gummiphilus]|uniref:Methyl-accepting chemotaxis protein n=1 Tax=Piscinibacter gummiphilus TaxID=946333 RepID=A0ABZ0CM20_9BURK|nr:methyl-accepting chemotaxis protein [Piscinibacter gummiphilus]WOB06034.1 methyl-accepting chemotaxis protein [Piscinibacter gummiphilus]